CALFSAWVFKKYIVAKRPAKKNVIPRGNIENWHADLRVVFLNRKRLPILVVARMRQPVRVIGCQRSCIGQFAQWVIDQRQNVSPFKRRGYSIGRPPQRIFGQSGCPVFVEPLFERSALIRPSVVKI